MVWKYVFLHKQYNYQPGIPLLCADDPVQTGNETNRFIIYISNICSVGQKQGWFYACIQPLRDVVTK